MGKQVSIACKPDGPYLVSNLADLRDAGGKPIEAKSMMALCRCGGSAKKPFCDGTHAKNGFSGARLSDGSADRLDTYTADGITIHDNRSICAHAGHCTAGLETVFRYGKEPWIVASGGLREKIIETVRNCPSGALACSSEGAQAAEPKREPAITVTRDGALRSGRLRRPARAGLGARRLDRAFHLVPLRRLEEQALLRRFALGRRIQGRMKPNCAAGGRTAAGTA